MTDKMRWRYGDTNPVVAAVDAATVIEMGDLVWQDVDDAKPASMIPKQSAEFMNYSLAKLMQRVFADKFLGVAMQRSRSGDTDPIRVATTGVFEFDCPSSTFELGNLAGPFMGGKSLHSQLVEKVTDSKYAVGRVDKRAGTLVTTVLVNIRSTVMTGGVEGSSSSGI